jgi:hypothetical protein
MTEEINGGGFRVAATPQLPARRFETDGTRESEEPSAGCGTLPNSCAERSVGTTYSGNGLSHHRVPRCHRAAPRAQGDNHET